MNNKPFKGLLVIELATVLAGPAVGMFFAELGAEVIKIENPLTGGDVTRAWRLSSETNAENISAYYHSVNWNKEVIYKNLKEEEDKNSVDDLIKKADIVISNFRNSAARKLGYDYQRLKAINPEIILGEITAYGNNSSRPGFDALIQAEAGWMHMNGDKDGPPVKMPVALIDILAAHQLKEGLLVALLKKYKTQKGSRVSVSLYDTAIASLANQASNFLNLNVIPERKGSLHPNIAPYGEVINCADGTPLLLAVGTEAQFVSLCKILNLDGLAHDKRFADNASRVINRTELHQKLSAAATQIPSETLLKNAKEEDVPLGPINNLSQVFSDEKAQALILTQKEDDGSISQRVKTTVFEVSNE